MLESAGINRALYPCLRLRKDWAVISQVYHTQTGGLDLVFLNRIYSPNIIAIIPSQLFFFYTSLVWHCPERTVLQWEVRKTEEKKKMYRNFNTTTFDLGYLNVEVSFKGTVSSGMP